MLDYELFLRLYREAQESASLEYFIGERGWQQWMDAFAEEDGECKEVEEILERIYDYAHKTLKEIREQYYSTRPEFCKKYRLSLRTIENWELEKCPEYIESFLKYTFLIKGELEKEKTMAEIED